jgi:hypothetical protein
MSLMADAWGASGGQSFGRKLLYVLCMGPILPVVGICYVLGNVANNFILCKNLQEREQEEKEQDRTSPPPHHQQQSDSPSAAAAAAARQSAAKIISGCHVVLGTSKEKLPATHVNDDPLLQISSAIPDALILGGRSKLQPQNSSSYMVQVLNSAGKQALLRSNILTDYNNQLRFLQGRSGGIVIAITAIQGAGYILSVVYRAANALPVSPVEGLGFALSIAILVHATLHTVVVTSHHPLVLYLSPEEEEKLLMVICSEDSTSTSTQCRSESYADHQSRTLYQKMALAVILMVGFVVAFTILVQLKLLRSSSSSSSSSSFNSLNATGPILFIIALLGQTTGAFALWSDIPCLQDLAFVEIICAIFSVIAMFVAVVATALNWHSSHFDMPATTTSSLGAHTLLPFVG